MKFLLKNPRKFKTEKISEGFLYINNGPSANASGQSEQAETNQQKEASEQLKNNELLNELLEYPENHVELAKLLSIKLLEPQGQISTKQILIENTDRYKLSNAFESESFRKELLGGIDANVATSMILNNTTAMQRLILDKQSDGSLKVNLQGNKFLAKNLKIWDIVKANSVTINGQVLERGVDEYSGSIDGVSFKVNNESNLNKLGGVENEKNADEYSKDRETTLENQAVVEEVIERIFDYDEDRDSEDLFAYQQEVLVAVKKFGNDPEKIKSETFVQDLFDDLAKKYANNKKVSGVIQRLARSVAFNVLSSDRKSLNMEIRNRKAANSLAKIFETIPGSIDLAPLINGVIQKEEPFSKLVTAFAESKLSPEDQELIKKAVANIMEKENDSSVSALETDAVSFRLQLQGKLSPLTYNDFKNINIVKSLLGDKDSYKLLSTEQRRDLSYIERPLAEKVKFHLKALVKLHEGSQKYQKAAEEDKVWADVADGADNYLQEKRVQKKLWSQKAAASPFYQKNPAEIANLAKIEKQLPRGMHVSKVLDNGNIVFYTGINNDESTQIEAVISGEGAGMMFPHGQQNANGLDAFKVEASSKNMPAMQALTAMLQGNNLGGISKNTDEKIAEPLENLGPNKFFKFFRNLYGGGTGILQPGAVDSWQRLGEKGDMQGFLSRTGCVKNGEIDPVMGSTNRLQILEELDRMKYDLEQKEVAF